MRQLNRRDLLITLGSSGILALAGSYGTRTRPVFAQATCTLTPQQTEGPYWFDARQVRRDITEGKPGVPLRLLLRVVSASTCLPIPNALAEIWHCDAAGIYSGYSAQGSAGQTFLRGIQTSDADGIVEFQTIYPGWYRGRTTHIHFKVHFGNQTLVYDGGTGVKVFTVEGISLRARRWLQINSLLALHAPGVSQGYTQVRRISGNNPFIAYAVINDGGQPGERSGDGGFVASS